MERCIGRDGLTRPSRARVLAAAFALACTPDAAAPLVDAERSGVTATLHELAGTGSAPVNGFLNEAWSTQWSQVGAKFGDSVAGGGDVNGDGYDDVLVGAPNHDDGQTNEGAAILYAGSASGLETNEAWTAQSNQASAFFGSTVAFAGDVNGDGYDDALVSAPYYDNGETDEGRVFLYLGSSTGLGATAAWTAESNQASAQLGSLGSLASAGDVNGDGYDDVIVATRSYDTLLGTEGQAWVYLGSATGLSATASWTASSAVGEQWLGDSVASVGDVNGDGYDDVGVTRLYAVLVYLGSAAGLETSAFWTLEMEGGPTVASGGDVNADGVGDILVGSSSYDLPGAPFLVGRALLFLGAASGPSDSPAWEVVGDALGGAALAAGDVDGDGYGDIVVGHYFPGYRDYAQLFLGSPFGAGAFPAWTSPVWGGGAPAGDVDGDGHSDVVVGQSGAAFLYAGGCPGGTADGDADSVPDACDACPGLDDRAYDVDFDRSCAPGLDGVGSDCDDLAPTVYAGAPELCDGVDTTCAGAIPADEVDRDTDGFLECGGDFEGPETVLVAEWSAGGLCGRSSFGSTVASAGDVNGDGFDDVLVGDPEFGSGCVVDQLNGAALVYFGSEVGLDAAPGWSIDGAVGQLLGRVVASGDVNGDGFGDVLAGGYYDGAALYLGSVTGPRTAAAWSVSSIVDAAAAGDVNGDGFDDLALGSLYPSQVEVYLGSASGLETTAAWTVGLAVADPGLGLSLAVGDVDGDAFEDLVVGAPGYSNGEAAEGQASVYRGSAVGLAATAAWEVESNEVGAQLGAAVAWAGDVNGDGFGDVAVGEPGGGYDSYFVPYPSYASPAGRANVYLGSASGLEAAPSWTVTTRFGSAGYGSSVSSAGDVDGDGYADLLVGSQAVHPYAPWPWADLYLGSADGLATAIAWSAEYGHYYDAGDDFGYIVAGAGDVNADGYADVLLGAPFLAAGARVELYLGRPRCGSGDADGDTVGDGCDACPGLDDRTFDVDADGSCSVALDGAPQDCDDQNAAIAPGAVERCDGLDNACAGAVPGDEIDADLDGFIACAECDDGDPAVYPGAPEICDGADNACTGAVGADEVDGDLDGTPACADCDDADPTAYPGASELCDGVDNTCAGAVPIDEVDGDGDGALACAECDDADPTALPGAPELCDGVDNTCAGAVPIDETDGDGDGALACAECDDADPTAYPGAPELCDGVDNGCVGALPADELDGDQDGALACADCDDADSDAYPGQTESCDGLDNDCDGVVDEGWDPPDGCGCASAGAASAAWWVLLGALAAGRRSGSTSARRRVMRAPSRFGGVDVASSAVRRPRT